MQVCNKYQLTCGLYKTILLLFYTCLSCLSWDKHFYLRLRITCKPFWRLGRPSGCCHFHSSLQFNYLVWIVTNINFAFLCLILPTFLQSAWLTSLPGSVYDQVDSMVGSILTLTFNVSRKWHILSTWSYLSLWRGVSLPRLKAFSGINGCYGHDHDIHEM